MARCGCAGASCSCVVVGEGAIEVTGSGSAANPYRVSGGRVVAGAASPTVSVQVLGSGKDDDPYTVTADAQIDLDELADVDVAGAAEGQVLAKQGALWRAVPPVTAPPGAIATGCGLDGDGSAGSPLQVQLDAAGYLECPGTAAGLRLSLDAQRRLNRSYASAPARDAAIPAPGEGMLIWRSDLGYHEVYTIGGWVRMPDAPNDGPKHWWWGSANGNHYWAIPNGNWNVHPGSVREIQVTAGHTYLFTSHFLVSPDPNRTVNANWRASGWVEGNIYAEIHGTTPAHSHPAVGTAFYSASPTLFQCPYYATATKKVKFEMRFASGGWSQSVWNPFSAPFSTLVDTGLSQPFEVI